MAAHTRLGEAGMSMSVTPRCDSASTMALITAGAAPIVPASPMPFTPSGLVGLGRDRVVGGRALGTSAAGGHQVVGERRRAQVAVLVVDGLLEQRLGDALDDAAVHLALDDQRVDLVAAVVDGDVRQQVDRAGLRVDLDHADVGAEREREVGRVVGDLGLEVGLHAVGQVVGGERLEGDRGQRHRSGRACPAPLNAPPSNSRSSSAASSWWAAIACALSITLSQAMHDGDRRRRPASATP